LHQSQIPRAADEPVQGSANFAAIATSSMGFGLSNSCDPSSYDGIYMADVSSTVPESSYHQTEPFYQAHAAPDYFTATHGEPQQVVM
jgi:hypothetical protein